MTITIPERQEIAMRLEIIDEQLARIREIVDNPEEPDTSVQGDECPHPEEKVIETTSMGEARSWMCLVCEKSSNVPFHPSAT